MHFSLNENERLDEVNDRLRLIQKTDGLTFGTDALLLAAFIRKKGRLALELGGGSGIISLLLATRERFDFIRSVEIQPSYAALISRNTTLNGLTDRLESICADIRDHNALGEHGSYDAVFSNPPYLTTDSGFPCAGDAKNTARHEANGTIYDFAAAAAAMLKYGGTFYTVYRTERLADLLSACRAHRLEPKRMTFVHARASLPPSMLLAEFRLGGKSGLEITRPLILANDGGNTADYDYLLDKGILPDDF